MTKAGRRAFLAAVIAQAAVGWLERSYADASQSWQRSNYRGRPVSLAAGPALAVAAAATGPGLAGAIAALGAGAAGGYDDLRGESGPKGFRGHLSALRRRELTTGAAKLVAIPAAGLVAASAMRPDRDVLLNGALVAGCANLLNLLDLRPGRALKVGVAGGVLLWQPGVVGSCAALLPADLGERRMLGDAGANALGAVLGVALASRLRPRLARQTALAAVVTLTALSERVSFSAVIERTPTLQRLDALGRLP